MANNGGAAGRRRQPGLPRGRHRRAGERARRTGRNPDGAEFRQAAGEGFSRTGVTVRSGDMKFGASMFFTDYSIQHAELARAMEERGFDTLWGPEHSHIPLSRKTPFILGTE